MAKEDDPDAISGPGAENVIPFKRADAPTPAGMTAVNAMTTSWSGALRIQSRSGRPSQAFRASRRCRSFFTNRSARALAPWPATRSWPPSSPPSVRSSAGSVRSEAPGTSLPSSLLLSVRKPHATNGPTHTQAALTPAEKTKLREALWPTVSDLAQAPDLIDRVVEQVQTMGVVNERELIVLTYIAATSRVLEHPVNLLAKGASSSGKSFTTTRTLELIGPDFVNFLSSSSALSLVYDDRPLAHTVLVIYEANQLQADENSMFAMLVRTLISEGRIVHQTTVEDPDSPTGRRVERIVREGPISLIVTTTGELHAENETRMLSWHVGESHEQTAAVMAGLAAHAAGVVGRAHGPRRLARPSTLDRSRPQRRRHSLRSTDCGRD